MKKKSILIIGSGPAGVSSAYFLKSNDKENMLSVCLVEKLSEKKYEIYHDMCGEAVSNSLFDELYPLKPRGVIEDIKRIRECWPGEVIIDSPAEGSIINRGIFLKSIVKEFEEFGGVFQNKEVKKVSLKNDKVVVDFGDHEEEFDYVIAADGANSHIRENLGVHGRTRRYILFIVDKKPNRGILEFHYDEVYEGDYKCVFPHEGNVKIGFPVLKNKRFEPEEEIIQKQSRFVAFGGLNKYVYGRILLVGDAACQANALSKGGIRPGMIAGRMAAEALLKDNPALYEKNWKKSNYSSELFLKAWLKYKMMKNSEITKLIQPFSKFESDSLINHIKLQSQLLTRNRAYLDIYEALDLEEKFGW